MISFFKFIPLTLQSAFSLFCFICKFPFCCLINNNSKIFLSHSFLRREKCSGVLWYICMKNIKTKFKCTSLFCFLLWHSDDSDSVFSAAYLLTFNSILVSFAAKGIGRLSFFKDSLLTLEKSFQGSVILLTSLFKNELELIHPNGICSGCTLSTLKQLTKTVHVEDGEEVYLRMRYWAILK